MWGKGGTDSVVSEMVCPKIVREDTHFYQDYSQTAMGKRTERERKREEKTGKRNKKQKKKSWRL